MAHLPMVQESDFNTKVLQADKPVLVDFYADWCGPCKVISPILEDLAQEYQGQISILKLDVDQAQQVAGQFGVMSIPTLIFFHGGKPVHKIVGAKSKVALKADVDRVLGAIAPVSADAQQEIAAAAKA